jgi:hypothetical protein
MARRGHRPRFEPTGCKVNRIASVKSTSVVSIRFRKDSCKVMTMFTRLLGLTIASSLAVSALADERHFAFTYDWFTPAKFEREIELTYTGFQGGGFFGTFEFEYGMTDRWVVAPYILFEKEGGKTKFQGFRLEQRYRLGDFAIGKVMPSLYFEVNKENDEAYELEGKLIASYMPTWDWIVSANLIIEQEMKSGEKTEVGYALGVSRRLKEFTLGAEAFGNWKENEHLWGPSIGYRFEKGAKLIGTAGIPYSRGATPQFRLLFGMEF